MCCRSRLRSEESAPVLENGLEPLIKPVLVNLLLLGTTLVIGMLLPHLNRIRDSVRFPVMHFSSPEP